MDIAGFSPRFEVRVLTEADLAAVYALCGTNPQYYRYTGTPLTEEGVRRDMTLTPPGVSADRKHFLGYWDSGGLIALLDLIEGYPTADTAYIGLFMVDGALAGRGVGTEIIGELCAALDEAGFARVRLAYGKNNPQSSHFWRKNGFVPAEERLHPDFGPVIVAERATDQREP